MGSNVARMSPKWWTFVPSAPQWRTKFDLDRYIPSLDTKTRLIEACEAIERNELVEDKESSNKKKKGKDVKAKSENPENTNKKGEKKKKKFFCTEHGQNTSHSLATAGL